jgi:uncharacterized protein (DUF924 family)
MVIMLASITSVTCGVSTTITAITIGIDRYTTGQASGAATVGAALDEQVRTRFQPVLRTVAAEPEDALLVDAKTALAAVIVLDQFSRNMFRGTPSAFASDAKALAIAETAIAKGFVEALNGDERLFLYLPFEHQENADAQARSLELISALGDPELTKYALAHKDIIDRFGRFPHRNTTLGRTWTAEELELLKGLGSSF